MLYAFNTTKETERNKGTKQQNYSVIDNSARSAESKGHSQFVLIETGDESSTRIGETRGDCENMCSKDIHVSSKAILNDNFENGCIRDSRGSRDSSITCNENLERLLKLAESEEVQKFHDMLAFSEDVKAFHSILSCIAMKQENSPPELRK